MYDQFNCWHFKDQDLLQPVQAIFSQSEDIVYLISERRQHVCGRKGKESGRKKDKLGRDL